MVSAKQDDPVPGDPGVRRSAVLRALAIVAVLGLGFAALAFRVRHIFPPFAIGAAYVFGAALFVSTRLTRGRWLVYNGAFVFLALAIVEVALFYIPTDHRRTAHKGTYTQHHGTAIPELGYGSIPERRVTTSQLYANGKLVYDVKYTIDEDGLRTDPAGTAYGNRRALFFGCSFAFGEGVADDETLPSAFQRRTGLGVINFGFHGYGPHQMLRAMEIGLPRKKSGRVDAAVVAYVALPTHIDRAAGRSPWDQHGPRYRLVDGRLRFQGPFSILPPRVEDVLGHWRLFTMLRGRLNELAHDERVDRATYLAIVAEANRLVQAQYGVPLHVLLWDVGGDYSALERERNKWLKRHLPLHGIRLVSLSERAPHLGEARYYIPTDRHPTGAAYSEAARVLAAFSAGGTAP